MTTSDATNPDEDYDMLPDEFRWELAGRITVVDHGADFATRSNFLSLMRLNALSVITFDPASRLHGQSELHNIEEFQIVANALLGNGKGATLYACLDPTMSATLEPLAASQLPQDKRTGARVLARLPLGTLPLDTIQELDSIDWLLLDAQHDNISILNNANETLRKTLAVQVRVPLVSTHRQQSDMASVCHSMAQRGFQCYRLQNMDFQSHLDENASLEKHQATQVASLDALFVPATERLDALTHDRLSKLAFLMDTVYGIHDFTYALLERIDSYRAKDYLVSRGYLTRYYHEKDTFTLTSAYSPAPW